MLLDGRRGKLALQVLDESGDVEGMHVRELADAAAVAPFRKTAGCVQVRLARVVVVDLGCEEFQHALGGFRSRREQGHLKHGGGQGREQVLMSSVCLYGCGDETQKAVRRLGGAFREDA